MSYITVDEELVWVSDRDLRPPQDPLRLAGERLANAVETYLYDKKSGVWMAPEFLAWEVARYDQTKTSSGNYADSAEFDPHEARERPHPPMPGTVFPNSRLEGGIRYPEHARQAEHIPTDAPKDGDA